MNHQNLLTMKLSHFLGTFLLLSAVFSCKKSEQLNIDYPAAFVVNGASNNVVVIDLNTDLKTGTLGLDGATFPHHVYLSPDKSQIAVAITSTDLSAGHGGHGTGTAAYQVIILDTKTGEIHHSIALDKLPHNAAYSPDGKELWVGQADAAQSKILVFNTSDFSQKASINVGKGLSETTFSVDGTKVYAANTDDNTITIIKATDKSILTTLPVGTAPVGAWPAENGKMYADNETSKTVSEIDVATNAITATINLGFKPGYVAYSDHHAELWVSDADNGKVVYFKLVAGKWTKEGEISTGADAHAIAFNADGTKAFVTNQGAGTLSIIKMSDHTKIKDIAVGDMPNGIALNL